MAVRKGSKYTPSHAAGTVTPRNRALDPVGKAIIYELPEATSAVRTVARTADMSVVTVRSISLQADLRASVTGHVDFDIDERLLVIRPVDARFDLTLLINRPLDVRPDLRTAVFEPMERSFDCAVVILHRVMSDADTRQSIYVYLFRESHEIQV